MKSLWVYVVLFIGKVLCIEHDFKGFDDSILFGINWPGAPEVLDSLTDENINNPENKEVLKVTTNHKESYKCHLPELKETENKSLDNYDGPSPVKLLKPLFAQKICSYRLESYWSYEVCHGRYIRQYHEERDGKQVKTQEYFLGHWTPEKQMRLEAEAKASQVVNELPKTTRVEGTALPYVEMVMNDGTMCDLNGRPRQTRVQYVCYSHGKHEVYSFKETSTCQYEIIILSPLLCEHPQFKPIEVSENAIDCFPLGDAPKKPRDLLKLEAERLLFHHQTVRLNNEKNIKDMLAVFKVEKIEKDGETHLKLELHPLQDDEELTEDSTTSKPSLLDKPAPTVIKDDSPVRAFLNGENCLNGGTGWWKYEFCYGRHVVQYHVDRGGEKTTLLLGKFNEKDHLNWISENREKAPKPLDQRTSISHFYSDGDMCDKTGKPRQTEVKLRCLENASSTSQVSLYLLEPRTCHYILGVESPLICDILPMADDNGLIKSTKPLLPPKDQVERKYIEDEDDRSKYIHNLDNE